MFSLSKKIFLFSLLLPLWVIPYEKVGAEITSSSESETARYQSNLGAYFWQKGDFSDAIEAWSKEAEIYHSQGLIEKESAVTLKIAQTYIILGQLSLATFQLKKVLSLTQEPLLLARAWNQLGNAYSRGGELGKALSAYKKSLDLERNLSILNNLVGLQQKQVQTAQLQAESAREGEEIQSYQAKAEFYRAEALKYAEEALSLSQTEKSPASVQTLIEWSKLSPTGLSAEQLEQGRNILVNLPASRTKAFLALNWAKLDSDRADYWLSQSAEVAETTGDVTAKSYVFLELGLLAERAGKLADALAYAQSAIDFGWSESIYDALYPSYWLAGRIYQKAGNKETALKNYRDAIAAFESLNRRPTKINVSQRLNFGIQVEPIYRTALELLLSEPSESNLKESLLISAQLRLAQLQNYFGDNCFDVELPNRETQVERGEKNAVVLSSIILEAQTHFILQLEDGTLRHSQASIGQTAITKLATDWYDSLTLLDSEDWRERSYKWQFWQQGEELYNLIIRPFEEELEQINPSTLIFVHDGVLRNLPMAALYDGEEFLAQKWASVSSLGLNFNSLESNQTEEKALVFGLSEARGSWSPLYLVPKEVQDVIDLVGGEKFLDREFTAERFFQQPNRKKYRVIHLATHGYFGGVAENSFILAYDKSLNALELEDSLSQSKAQLELMVLSACETALGSDRSVLGLAGVALRSGVRAVLGSFWAVQDHEQGELIKGFYVNLYQKNLDKAQALQQIQIRQIERNTHPSMWAALNLIAE